MDSAAREEIIAAPAATDAATTQDEADASRADAQGGPRVSSHPEGLVRSLV